MAHLMTNREQALTTMFTGLKTQLEQEADVYQENEDFKDEVKTFESAFEYNKKCGIEAHVSNSGFSLDKLAAKEKLSDMASNLSGKAYYKFRKLGKLNLAEQLHTEPAEYLRASDSNCASLAQGAIDLMRANLEDLGPKTVTVEMLEDLRKCIVHFEEMQGTSANVHEVSPTLTKKYKDSFEPVLVSVENLKWLGRDFKEINLGFFERFMASTVVPTINVHHTTLSISATAKSDESPLPDVVFTLS